MYLSIYLCEQGRESVKVRRVPPGTGCLGMAMRSTPEEYTYTTRSVYTCVRKVHEGELYTSGASPPGPGCLGMATRPTSSAEVEATFKLRGGRQNCFDGLEARRTWPCSLRPIMKLRVRYSPVESN